MLPVKPPTIVSAPFANIFSIRYLVHSVHIYQPIRDGRQYDVTFRIRARVLGLGLGLELVDIQYSRAVRPFITPFGLIIRLQPYFAELR